MFGPTWIGDFQSEGQASYFLRYPGLMFEFPLPEESFHDLVARGEHPMELPGHPPPVARRMWVFAAGSPSTLPISARLEEPEDDGTSEANDDEHFGRDVHIDLIQ